jgi:hypothetical protein
MRLFAFSLVLCLITVVGYSEEPSIMVAKNFSDKQLRKVESKVFKKYGVKVAITVLARNAQNQITNLILKRYRADGAEASSCSSDTFGLLLITPKGCRIVDAGYESNLSMKK